MFVRKSLAAFVTVTMTAATLALTAGTAHADPDDTLPVPVEADIVGTGSDTSQNALFRIANAYNAQTPAPTSKLLSYAATGGGMVTLHNGAIARPNGSTAGKNLLYGASNNVGVDFARSSSGLSTAEVSAGLQSFPFALDTQVAVVSGSVPSNAPASLSRAQILSIYKGDFTNWSQVGGTAGTIVPLIPQDGSGSRSFFLAQLQAENGGTAPALAASVQTFQENDDTAIRNNPNAVAPFSIGRAALLGTTVRVETGFRADRALYNVVRGTDVGNTQIQAIFGQAGFVCSAAARPLIEAAGFKQFALPASGGVCGQITQTSTTNFTLSAPPALSDDTTFVPTTADLIGAGSDTSQNALFRLAESYNGGLAAGAPRLATYAATGGGQISLPSGPINRPNGSTAGKNLLYGASNNTDIDFARSSSGLSTAEVSAGLQSFPFALDTQVAVVSGSVPSNAPASLTRAQILSIYKGDVTNWSQLGGTAGVIVPLIPQDGSGSRSFFLAQLQAENGGTAPALAASVQTFQENDDTAIKSNPNAVAPFSIGRAALLGTTVRVETGFRADRALYNVVRGTDVGNTTVQALFATGGFVCSDAARDEIIAAGFKQFDRPENGGVCGQVTQTSTTNFETNDPATTIATTTDLVATSSAPRTLRLVATVAGSTTPTGSVAFTNGATALGTAELIGGVATLNLSNVTPGAYTVTATYTPAAGTAFVASTDTAAVTVADNPAPVATRTTLTASNPAAKSVRLVAQVSGSPTPTGTVTFRAGSTVLRTVPVSGGTASFSRTGAAPGSFNFTATYTPSAGSNFTASSASRTLRVKTSSSLKESFVATTQRNARSVRGTVTVTLSQLSSKATGKVTLREGRKLVGTGTLRAGKVTMTLQRAKVGKGRSTITISYPGSSVAFGTSKRFTITFR